MDGRAIKSRIAKQPRGASGKPVIGGNYAGLEQMVAAARSHSPGYRLILNNVLFPAAEKKKQRT
jgi:hypothetical protein